MPRLIDAEAFAEKVYRAWDLWEKKENDCFVFSDIITPMLISMPTVDAVEVKRGHWMPYEFATNNRWRKCSVCGTADEYINENGAEAIRRYCPFCGAKMDEVEEDADK